MCETERGKIIYRLYPNKDNADCVKVPGKFKFKIGSLAEWERQERTEADYKQQLEAYEDKKTKRTLAPGEKEPESPVLPAWTGLTNAPNGLISEPITADWTTSRYSSVA